MVFYELEIQQGNKKEKLDFKWIDYKNISKSIFLAVIAAEDQKFFIHNGFDFESIKDAGEDYFAGKRLRGASTISQQVAKNLFLWNGKNIVRKLMIPGKCLTLLLHKNRLKLSSLK